MEKFNKPQFEKVTPSGSPKEREEEKGGEIFPLEEAPDRSEALPVREDEAFVSYLGVKLEKAENRGSQFVPKIENYQDYINDRFSLELQKKIAISFLQGDPILIEGGTSIGKTTTVRKMASELGWEVHYVNLNSATDVEDLMGRYVPNPRKSGAEDPEYVFADGKVTSGLRQEEGKVKIIILDEINAAAPNILIRLHEVLDRLEKNEEVVLSEDASESIATDKNTTKIIALMNPPGKGYMQREPLDPAQLRRWVYQKEVTDLPEETFSHSVDALFGLASKNENIPEESLLVSQEQALSLEQLAEIPGMKEIAALYKEFHQSAKELVRARKIAEDQPQLFTYDDREEPKRVINFVSRFFRGDITETFQEALRYYYTGKLLEEEDKQKLENLIQHVKYVPKIESKRKGLDKKIKKTKRGGESSLGETATEQMHKAKEIMGHSFLGPEQIKTAFGIEIKPEDIPEMPFTKKTLERAKELNQMLILRTGQASDGEPLTMKQMSKMLKGKTKDGGKTLYSDGGAGMVKDDAWYKNEDFYTKEAPQPCWALVSKEIITESTDKNYLEQTERIISYLKNEVFKDEELPETYHEAVEEFEEQKEEIKALIGADWEKAAQKLEKLKITRLTRQSPAEVLYDILVNFQNNNERLLEETYTWTSRFVSDGGLVGVGGFGADGADVGSGMPGSGYDVLGVSFSRHA